jgi:cell division protein ZapA
LKENKGGGTFMAGKNCAEVIIGGKVYTLSGYEEEGYLQRIATYINSKISEIDSVDTYRRFPADMKATMVQLNLADDFFKAKSEADKLQTEVEQKEKELYDLKHDLISAQIKAESDENTIKELEAQTKELLINKAKLEASLEDALLTKAPSRRASAKA